MNFFKKCMKAISVPEFSGKAASYSILRTLATGSVGYGTALLAAYLDAPSILIPLTASATPALLSSILRAYEYKQVIAQQDTADIEKNLSQLENLEANLAAIDAKKINDEESPLNSKQNAVREINSFVDNNRLNAISNPIVDAHKVLRNFRNNPLSSGLAQTFSDIIGNTLSGLGAQFLFDYFVSIPTGNLHYLKDLPAALTSAYFSTKAALAGHMGEAYKFAVAKETVNTVITTNRRTFDEAGIQRRRIIDDTYMNEDGSYKNRIQP